MICLCLLQVPTIKKLDNLINEEICEISLFSESRAACF